ncbi:MAG TPA: TolC family protein [Bryobacteraceae bacterium]|jgi:outer membrane protein
MDRILTALFVTAGSTLLLGQPPAPAQLTRQEAEHIALANNPRIQASQLLAKVQGQVVRETRAGELPSVTGNLTGVETNEASRISAGALTASRLLTHVGGGVQVSQLITDFGHTSNLVASEKLKEKARQADALASSEDIVLATDQVFYSAIEAKATVQVADETVAARQALVDQVSALTAAKLKSTLDLSFAQVDLSQAKLLQLDARNNLDAAKTALNAVLGYDKQMNYELVEDATGLPALPPDPDSLTTSALDRRPDLQSLRFTEQATQKFSRAQHAQLFPTISALGVVGGTPVGSNQYFNSDWYGAAGLNIGIPIFDGFRLRAQSAEAALMVRAASEHTRDLRDQIVRDVRTAWLNASAALQKVTVSGELLNHASTALDLAKTRYQIGLSSIVELSQAQLQQTQAAIGNANARAQYSFAIANLQYQVGANSH